MSFGGFKKKFGDFSANIPEVPGQSLPGSLHLAGRSSEPYYPVFQLDQQRRLVLGFASDVYYPDLVTEVPNPAVALIFEQPSINEYLVITEINVVNSSMGNATLTLHFGPAGSYIRFVSEILSSGGGLQWTGALDLEQGSLWGSSSVNNALYVVCTLKYRRSYVRR